MDSDGLRTSMNFTVASSSEYISTSSSRLSEGGEMDLLVPNSSQTGRGYNQKQSSGPAVVMATVLPSVGPSPATRFPASSSSKVVMVRPQGIDADPNMFPSFSSMDSISRNVTTPSHVAGGGLSSALPSSFSEIDESSLASLQSQGQLHSQPHTQPLPPHQQFTHSLLQRIPVTQPYPQPLPSSLPQLHPLPPDPMQSASSTAISGVLGELHSSLSLDMQGPSALLQSIPQQLTSVGGGKKPLSSSSKLKLSPVRPQRTTKLLLPKPPSSQSPSGLAYLFPGNFSISPQLQSVLGGNVSHTSSKTDPTHSSQQSSGVSAAINKHLLSTDSAVKSSMSVAPLHSKPRRPCNCKASKCLKLYCDCFANGEFCRPTCNCTGCHNNMLHERDRAVAIKVTIERNPLAFHPKVAKHKQGDTERRHIKGCHCKRSGCLKNYCECYEAKIPCSVLCKCVECKNRPGSEMKSLLQLADVAENCPYQQKPGVQLLTDLEQSTVKPVTKMGYGRRLPLAFVNQPVVEACTLCLLQVVMETESSSRSEAEEELGIIREFGNCLEQIISAAKAASSSDEF